MDTKVADPLIGALVDGRYRVRARVARGGMATVYTANDERLERVVALKIIHPAHAGDARFVERFTDEAKTIARLTHPNVVAVYDQGAHDGLPYLVMEFVRGRTLREVLAERHGLNAQEALSIMEQVLAAVAAAHRSGLVHRDVKPENVLVADAPNATSLVDSVVKVADFGLARAVEAADDGGGHLLATAAYVAPELVTDGHADARTDVYSAGIVLFEMLTGRVPYDGDRPVDIAWQHVDQDVPAPSTYVSGLPPMIDELVARATRRDPGGRPTDAGAMLAEVQTAREDVGVQAHHSRLAAQPTMPVSPVSAISGGPTTLLPASDPYSVRRPGWARLPSSRAASSAPPRRAYRPHAARPSGLAQTWTRLSNDRRGRPALIAAVIVVALLLAVGGWWFGFGRYTIAPSLVNLTRADATQAATRYGFRVQFADSQYSENIPKDTVLGQRPDPRSRIVKGSTITLTLSLGPERYQVPDEVGKSYDLAVDELEKIKATPKRTDRYDNNMPAGNVLGTDPPAGQTVAPGAQVTVVVSKGRAPITLPSVIGKDVNEATATLQQLGLKVAVVQQDSDKPANQVISMDPQDGSGVEKGQTVTLTVSKGPPQVQVPDLTNMDINQATQTLAQLGLQAVPDINLGGHVHNQNPAPNTPVPPGTQVHIFVYPP